MAIPSMPLGYLERLTLRLSHGLASVSETRLARHRDYFLQAQGKDGGFAGRDGGSDPYYSSFGMRGLALLGVLRGEQAEQSASFIRKMLGAQLGVVDFFSLIYAGRLVGMASGADPFSAARTDWAKAVADQVLRFRRPDGGFAKGDAGAASSTYHTFLSILCLELLSEPVPEPERVVAFLHSQRGEDGGFLEIRAQKRSGANPTAAAVASLKTLGALDSSVSNEAREFLLELQTDEGGFRANTRIPIADLLSTFTAALTLSDLGAYSELDHEGMVKFVRSMEREQGGFHGAEWDEAHDVEYSFYGLGSLAILELRGADPTREIPA